MRRRKKKPPPKAPARSRVRVVLDLIKPALLGVLLASLCHLLPERWRLPCDLVSKILGKF